MPRAVRLWSSEDESFLTANHGVMTIKQLASGLGRSMGSVRGKVTEMGLSKKDLWSDWQVAMLIETYKSGDEYSFLNLKGLGERLGRSPSNISRKAKLIGLEVSNKRARVLERKPASDGRKFKCAEERKLASSARMKARHADLGHPMKGKSHSDEARAKISRASKASSLMITEERRSEIVMKALKTRLVNGSDGPPKLKRGSWAAGWREIGGKRNYYRSSWEANYARYLEWLKVKGEITEWQHEPEVFWFEAIKRGVRSYKPDFRVWENGGFSCLHEVKGWMDARSKTCLSRMKKYHPTEKIVLIDSKHYAAIKLKMSRIVEGWE